jgi:hypothetical protein
MGDGLKHHYAHNRHHPEFFGEDGVDGMSLVDVIEMLADWKAATEHHDDGDLAKSLGDPSPKPCGTLMTRLGRTTGYGAIIDVPGVGGGVVDRLAELELPVVPYNGGEAPIDKERFVNARAEDYWTLRERFEQRRSISTPMTTSSPRSSARSSGASTPEAASRSNRKTTCAKGECRHPTEPTRWP